jgi:hypothetical protein
VDAVSVHPYRTKGKAPETIFANYQKTKALLKEHAPDKDIPVVLGEWGYNRHDVDPKTQANYAVRQKLMGMMLGSPVNVWHDWKGDIMQVTDDPKDPEQQFSLVNKAIEPYPAYQALQTMQKALHGQQFKSRLNTDNDQHMVLQFEGKGKQTVAAWTTGPDATVLIHGKPTQLSGKPVFISK